MRKIFRDLLTWALAFVIAFPLFYLGPLFVDFLPVQKAYAAFPFVQSITQTSFGTDATSHLVSMPATVNADDLLITLFVVDGFPTITTPSGWTLLFSQGAASGLVKFAGFVKKAAGTEGGTTVDVVTDVGEKAAAQVYRITGWRNSGTLLNDVKQNNDYGTTSLPNPPGLNPGWGTDDILWIAAEAHDTLATTTAYPTDYTNGTATQSGGTGPAVSKVSMATARRELAVAIEDPGSFTISSSEMSIWVTIAVRPAPSPSVSQSAYRWRNDDGSESTATWKDTVNTAISNVNVGSDAELIRLRFAIKETNNLSFALDSRIEFSSDATSCTTGSWTAMDTSTTAWRVTDSANITNDAATTQQISSPDIFTAGSILDTSNPDPTAITIQNNTTEVEFAFKGIGASFSTTYRFRITDNGTTLNTYTNCGQASTESAPGPTTEEVMRHGNWFSGGVEQSFFWAD